MNANEPVLFGAPSALFATNIDLMGPRLIVCIALCARPRKVRVKFLDFGKLR